MCCCVLLLLWGAHSIVCSCLFFLFLPSLHGTEFVEKDVFFSKFWFCSFLFIALLRVKPRGVKICAVFVLTSKEGNVRACVRAFFSHFRFLCLALFLIISPSLFLFLEEDFFHIHFGSFPLRHTCSDSILTVFFVWFCFVSWGGGGGGRACTALLAWGILYHMTEGFEKIENLYFILRSFFTFFMMMCKRCLVIYFRGVIPVFFFLFCFS